MQLRAYAKINFTLDVFSKRPDGYHGIASVMQAISLYDTLDIEGYSEPGVHFLCDGPESEGIPTDDTNLVVRAARLAIEDTDHCPVWPGVRIHLHKFTPSQAGLGGGSSDAAYTLFGVNRVMKLDHDSERLHLLASSLGSDIPFFLMGGTAVARGRGEQLTSAPDAPPLWLVVVKPDENVSTGWAYGALDADAERVSHRGTKRMEQAIAEQERDLVVSRMCNDFEQPVFSHYPKLAWLNDELLMAGAQNVRLCGSGSAVFAVAADEAAAHRIAGLMRSRYPKTHVCRTLSRAESQPV